MRIISKRPFNDAKRKYPNDAAALDKLYSILSGNAFGSPDDLKKAWKSLDNFKYKDRWWVLDVGGNNLRMLAFIEFRHQTLYVKHIVNHADYDKLCARYAKETKS